MSFKNSEIHFWGVIGACWGVAGILLLLARAIYRLGDYSLQALHINLTPLQWFALLANIIFMAYSEGYMGFQKKFSPRVAARARHLCQTRDTVELLLAPLFCMSFFNAPKKRIITSSVLLVMIVCLIIAFRLLPQPWRGIMDAGVVVGLFWGSLSILWCCYKEFMVAGYKGDPELATPSAGQPAEA